MPGPSAVLSIDGAEQTLTVLSGCLERFIGCWEEGRYVPHLEDFLPDAPEFRHMALVELIKVDLEYRWLYRNLPRRVEEYLEDFPELAEDGVPTDLIYEEFHLRRLSGLRVDPREYLERFPAQAHELGRLLGADEYVSTALHHKQAGRKVLDAIQPGQQLDDFDLLTLLGRGAFARVFLARQRSMQRLVALKVSADQGAEPQTLARFDHEGVVRVYDQRALPDQELRLLYMQYVAGGTLQDVVRTVRETPPAERTGRLLFHAVDRLLDERGEVKPAESAARRRLAEAGWPEIVCRIGARLAAALDYAHGQGVLHRDVKPANVLLTAEGQPKLADFNVSFASSMAGVTPEAFFGGSLAYMSPEQIEAMDPSHKRRPDSLDGRSDLYSLGVLLWELLTGRRPFEDEEFHGNWSATLQEMVARRRQGPGPEARTALPPDCPPALVQVLERCLAPEAEDRWASGAELAEQLELCLKPRALELLRPAETGLCRRVCRYAVPVVFLAAAVPNILAGVFNSHYNEAAIIRQHENVQAVFATVRFTINSIAYPVGLGLIAWLAWTVACGLRDVERGTPLDDDRLLRLRRRALHLGHLAALIGVVAWTVAGVAYPLTMHLAAADLGAYDYIHFFASLVLCGLVAAAYPFFGATWFSVRVLYPALLRGRPPARTCLPVLQRVNRLCGSYLALAALVPSLGVLALVLFRQEHSETERFALQVFGLTGFVGFLLIFFAFHRPLQSDLQALAEIGPHDD